MKITDTIAAFILLGLDIIAIAVLAAMGIAVPDVLVTLALVLAGVSGGAAIPRTGAVAALPPAPPTGAGVIQR